MTIGLVPAPAKLAPREIFLPRVTRSTLLALSILVATLAAGTFGHRLGDHFEWLDAFHQSAMLFAGMGPVKAIDTTAGMLFDRLYALFCAVILLGAGGVPFMPLVHRILHRCHLEDAGAGH